VYSPELYPNADRLTDIDGELRIGLQRVAERNQLQAILIAEINCSLETFETVAGFNLPTAPFNGADKFAVEDVLKECFKLHAKPHVHAIGEYALAQFVRKLSHSEHGTNRLWFIPFTCLDRQVVFLGFPRNDCEIKGIPDGIDKEVAALLLSRAMLTSHRAMADRLRVMEMFVKEVGHDVASSVQATIATLRNISQGRIKGDAVQRKAKQVEDEVMAAFRIADGLGIAVDPNYIIREPRDYDLIDVLNDVIEHHRSEADERRNSIKLNTNTRSIRMYGDRKAIEVALGHLLMNAIKYSFDDSYVSITTMHDSNEVSLRVTNKGLELPGGEERGRIWEFGYRGRGARERHVNGSGIGLFTVRKIVQAHLGSVTANSDGNDPSITRFVVTLPKDTLGTKLIL
jgi:signal transduction histidine kinase